MVCLNCGNEIADNVKFCKYCGARAELSRPKKRFCTICGTELSGTAKFCKKCGAETGAAVAAAVLAAGVTIPAKGPVTAVTGSDEPPPAASALCCPQCGAPLSANRKFCKKCGAALTASEGAAAVKAERTEQASSAQTKTKRSERNGQADSVKRPGSSRSMSTGAKRIHYSIPISCRHGNQFKMND